MIFILKKINLIITLLMILTSNSISEINTKKWDKICNENDNCIIAIENRVKLDGQESDKSFAKAYIRIGFTNQQSMDLINKDDKTYKLKETKKGVPVLFINLPLNTDLKKNPLLRSGNKNLANLTYLKCENQNGCTAMTVINNKIINSLKKGKTMQVVFGVYGLQKNYSVKFPLKNFTKSYTSLVANL